MHLDHKTIHIIILHLLQVHIQALSHPKVPGISERNLTLYDTIYSTSTLCNNAYTALLPLNDQVNIK